MLALRAPGPQGVVVDTVTINEEGAAGNEIRKDHEKHEACYVVGPRVVDLSRNPRHEPPDAATIYIFEQNRWVGITPI